MDFAENFTFIAQECPQGVHWNNRMATIHPIVIYYREAAGEGKAST